VHPFPVPPPLFGRLNAGIAAAIANVDVKPGAFREAVDGKTWENHGKTMGKTSADFHMAESVGL